MECEASISTPRAVRFAPKPSLPPQLSFTTSASPSGTRTLSPQGQGCPSRLKSLGITEDRLITQPQAPVALVCQPGNQRQTGACELLSYLLAHFELLDRRCPMLRVIMSL